MNVLIACEESQEVCKAFRLLGHRVFSCDLQECSGGHPEWHVIGNCLPLLNGDCEFTTQDGMQHHQQGEWQLIVAHPPCTFLSNAGARWMFKKKGKINQDRLNQAMEAKDFFFKILNAKCKYIAIENPRPLAIVGMPQPTTVIQPYEFGEQYSKATCLWLKNLPPLMSTLLCGRHKSLTSVVHSAKKRSKTFHGIAKAMAEQWSYYIYSNDYGYSHNLCNTLQPQRRDRQ